MPDAASHCMEASLKKLLPLTLFVIAVTSLFSVQPAQAYTVTLEQMGSNVVANGSGAINLSGLTPPASGIVTRFVYANQGTIITGAAIFGNVNSYAGFTGPTSFGSGGPFNVDTGSGDQVGIQNFFLIRFLDVPVGYVSNTALTSSATWNNATFTTLGVTPGTYEWTWGTGLP